MRRARWRRWAASVVAAAAASSTSGCSTAYADVLVVGLDADGTPVVGAVDCAPDLRDPADVIVVFDDSTQPQEEVWRLQRDGSDPVSPGSDPGSSDLSDPVIGGVPMVAIGDPTPPGASAVGLGPELLPDRLDVEAFLVTGDAEPLASGSLDRTAEPDTYLVASANHGWGGLDAVEASARVDSECDREIGMDGGTFLLVMGTGSALVLLTALPIGVATRRQFRRAGTTAALRRAAMAPPR